MACFTLNEQQRVFLSECISNGLCRYDTDQGMEDAMTSLLAELEAGTGSIEITVIADAAQYGSATMPELKNDPAFDEQSGVFVPAGMSLDD